MKLVELLERRLVGTSGNKLRFGIFKCSYCNSTVERTVSNGKRDLSCGCVRYSLTSKSNTVHGDSKVSSANYRLYHIWVGMRDRCNNQNNQDYKYYGGKGIVVADVFNDYTKFKEWSLSNGYIANSNLQIDRIDSSQDYSPNNCRWVSPRDNQRNRAEVLLDVSKVLEIRKLLLGTTPLFEIANTYGVSIDAIRDIKNNRTWQDVKLEGD